MKRGTLPLLVLGTLALPACSGEKPGGDAHPAASGTSAAPLSSSAASPGGAVSAGGPAAAASALALPPIGAPPACKISGQKVWGTGANKVTGLTDVDLPDGGVAIGLALGNDPHVLVIGKGGVGKLTRVVARAGTDLAKKIAPADGVRSVMRVTPVKADATHVEAFVDYHDDYKDKRRHVACGPADGDAAWINFDGVPLLDRAEQPTGEERAKLFKSSDPDGDTGYHELRDCRTFSDPSKNETWIVGSELRATDNNGTVEWKSSLVIDRGPKVHEVHLHELDLKGAPPHLINFEVPMLHPLHDGSYVLTARYADSMLAAILGANKTLSGPVVKYPGYPARADVAEDGNDTVIATSMQKGNKEVALRALRISGAKPVLPRALVPIVTDDDNKDSESEPDFLRDEKGQRWMSYIEGERGNGHLEIVPINADFQATGRPFSITEEDDRASDATIVEVAGVGLMVVFLRPKGTTMEVVTEQLSCEVVAK
ncbi:MAG: hypothetical protein ABJE95_37680 [Byssovorax sp.]